MGSDLIPAAAVCQYNRSAVNGRRRWSQRRSSLKPMCAPIRVLRTRVIGAFGCGWYQTVRDGLQTCHEEPLLPTHVEGQDTFPMPQR